MFTLIWCAFIYTLQFALQELEENHGLPGAAAATTFLYLSDANSH